jgi:hypothetical protein
MKKTLIGIVIGLALAAGVYFILRGTGASAGPNGGDVVPLQNGAVKAELVANQDTGELMVHTWDKDLKSRRPIKSEPLIVGSDQQSVELAPHPMSSDPPGFCSRFYGYAEWARGGRINRGWMHQRGQESDHHDFAWQGCWSAGRSHGPMWTEMGERRRHGSMGPGSGRMGGE